MKYKATIYITKEDRDKIKSVSTLLGSPGLPSLVVKAVTENVLNNIRCEEYEPLVVQAHDVSICNIPYSLRVSLGSFCYTGSDLRRVKQIERNLYGTSQGATTIVKMVYWGIMHYFDLIHQAQVKQDYKNIDCFLDDLFS